MNRQSVTNWLRQRPWLIMPVLGIIPLVGVPILYQRSFELKPQTVSVDPVPSVSTSTTQTVNVAPSPNPNHLLNQPLSPAPEAKSKPVPKPVPKAAVVPSKKTTPPHTTPVQPVLPAFNLSVDAAIQMRVLLHKGVASLPISTSAGGDVIDVQSGRRLSALSPQTGYQMQADGKTILLNSNSLPSLIWIDPAVNGVTFVGDRGYRGRLLIVSNESRLWVVNYVNLQQYLYSVVGSEVSPSWPMEALKAQAVAARSYALTYHLKPVNRELYDLGNDEYYQVYKGIESEASRTRQAVNSTSGEFVSYRGGVVESLYAATDDIVMEAFQGKGMSQIGALNLAEQGQDYRRILATYYAGTGVARIEMDIE